MILKLIKFIIKNWFKDYELIKKDRGIVIVKEVFEPIIFKHETIIHEDENPLILDYTIENQNNKIFEAVKSYIKTNVIEYDSSYKVTSELIIYGNKES